MNKAKTKFSSRLFRRNNALVYGSALAALVAAPTLRSADPVISNVTGSQRAGTKLVDIGFSVLDADSDQLAISVEISDDGGNSFLVPGSALTGDTTVNATSSATSHTLVWDAGVDFNQQFKTNMVIRVIANDGSIPDPPPTDGQLLADMVLIPAGSFMMGRQGAGNEEDELPVHSVDLSAFYLDRFEVTKALWDKVQVWGLANGYADLPAGRGQGRHHPAHTISWFSAVKWCNAHSEMGGLAPVYFTDATKSTVYRTGDIDLRADFVNWGASGFRLPTEAEWEKAARGMLVGNVYPWGDAFGESDANYAGSNDPFEGVSRASTPVGFYDGGQVPSGSDRVNGYGLYDVGGNVAEWCWDWKDPNWYSNPGATVPDTRGPESSPDGKRVLRGGSWGLHPFFMQCSERIEFTPEQAHIDKGFRAARRR